ncbi:alpha-protein kinase 2 [Mobula hypostoma]|uniref:alpha-protein kinase 2 n=1 Tax=Mobula hypostoma TaxID=723540 RepID=UPI002FC3611E
MLKDGKVHTLKLQRCMESDASVYQVSARNSKGFAICSSVLQVGFSTEAQVKRQMMQKLEDRHRAGKAHNSPEANSPRGHSETHKDDGPTAIRSEHAENGARPPADGEAARRFEGTPAASGQIISPGEVGSSAVSLHPNTDTRHQLNEVPVTAAGCQMKLSVRDQSYNPRMDDLSAADIPRGTKKISPMSKGDFIRESLPKSALQSCSTVPLWGETPPLSADEGYYFDFLVCSDVLNDEDDAAWRRKLDSSTHLLLSAEREDLEIDRVILTRHLSPAGHPTGSTSAPRCQPKDWVGRTPASEGSRAPANAADQTCSMISSELPSEIGVASREGMRSPASGDGLQEMTAGRKGVELISAGRADFVSLEGGKTTEAGKRQVLKEECWQNTSLKEDNPENKRSRRSEESHSTGELLDTGEMYKSPQRTNTTELFAVNVLSPSAADSRLPRANDSPANIPPALVNPLPVMEGESIHRRNEETSALEKRSSSSEGSERQKNEEVTHLLSAEKMKFTLDKKRQMQPSSAGKENLNKTKTVIKGIFHRAVEKAVIKKEQEVEKVKDLQKEERKELDTIPAPKMIQKIHAEMLPDVPGKVKLWCLFGDIHADSTIIWTKDGEILTKSERSAGDETPVSLAIVQTTKKNRGLYQCSLKNVYGSVSCEFDFTTEVLNELLSCQAVEENLGKWEDSSLGTPQDSAAEPPEFNQLKSCEISRGIQGEKIELLQPIIEKELASECAFQPKIYGSITTEETHFGEGLHRKAFRTKVIYGLVPLFDPGHSCVLKIHNAISYGIKTKNELLQRNYILAVQECHVQNAARQYSNMFSAVGTLVEGFGEAPEIIPIYLIHRPANNIPYATVEEELIGDFVKYSVKDGRELNVGRKESEVGQKCCTFQHWVYEWTEGNLLVTDLQGVGMKLTDVGIATCQKGYKGFKGNCSVSFIDQFKALHQCNIYCKIMGLKSLNLSQHKPRRNPPMKTPLKKAAPGSAKKMLVSPTNTVRNFTSQAQSIPGDRSIHKYL